VHCNWQVALQGGADFNGLHQEVSGRLRSAAVLQMQLWYLLYLLLETVLCRSEEAKLEGQLSMTYKFHRLQCDRYHKMTSCCKTARNPVYHELEIF